MFFILNENDMKNFYWRVYKEILENGIIDFFVDNFKIMDIINFDLINVDKWFLDNNMKRNYISWWLCGIKELVLNFFGIFLEFYYFK